ncbi:MAG TPA: hypothetical protein VKR56_09215, partial [Candidatus Cybelea sp.]|nr:hypothetical protein [Candidatus Cybelea sp.]
KGAPPVALTLGGLLVAALMFQLFFRYQYLENQGALWRIDRITQQICQVDVGQARCSTTPSNSLSTSVSTSTSTSLSPPAHQPRGSKS